MSIDDVTLPDIHFDFLYSVFILQKQTFWIKIPFRKTHLSIYPIKKSHRQPLKKISSSGSGGGKREVGGSYIRVFIRHQESENSPFTRLLSRILRLVAYNNFLFRRGASFKIFSCNVTPFSCYWNS